MKNSITSNSAADIEAVKKGSLSSTTFALVYHIVFLGVFLKLGVYPMFYFNIGSVLLFLGCIFCILKTNHILTPYFLSAIEVVTHQILADYYLGVDASFHYFMIVISTLAFIVFPNRKKLAAVFCFIPALCFIGMEMLREIIIPQYLIPERCIFCIKFANVSLSILVVIYRILVYANTSFELKNSLKNKVDVLAKDMQLKNEEIISIQNNTIISLSNLVENRDSDTGKHIQRTSEYVRLIAEETKKAGFYTEKLTDEAIETYVKAAPMHDIGKIVVSDTVLKKQGRLTNEEFLEIQKHTVEGGRIVEEVLGTGCNKEYLKIATKIATYHHEKWDGTGYPKKLKGEEIPLCARIMAVADVFDALVSPRCYKEPFTVDVACSIIKNDCGKHFDPVIAQIFLNNKDKAVEIMERLQ